MPIKKSSGESTPQKTPPKTKTKKEEAKKKAPPKKKTPPKKETKPKVGAHGNKKDPKTGLTLQQEKFVRIYCGIDGVMEKRWKSSHYRSIEEGDDSGDEGYTEEMTFPMGNAVKSYMGAYPGASYDSARALSSDLLANINIKVRIKHYLEVAGWSSDNAKLQHLSVMNQHAELPSKMRAVELFYKVTGELPDEKKITLELSEDDRETIEAVLSGRKKALKEIADEIITSPSDLSSDYPSANDEGKSDQ